MTEALSETSRSRTSEEEWSNFEDSEDQGSVSDESDVDGDLTDQQSDDADDKRHGQSDTETRNLLDDADFEEDVVMDDCTSSGVNLHPMAPDELDDETFAMSSDQRQYYQQVFLHLMYLTQGDAQLDGALNGTDERVVAFFRKSGLETPVLGQVWDLADINVDGKLNQHEFAVAMHLIVLNTKGGVPIPKHLPAYFDLRATPSRFDESPRSSEGISLSSSASTHLNGIQNGQSAATDAVVVNPAKQHSLSDDRLHALSQRTATEATFNPVTEFASDPPLCVDRVPLAVRSNHGSNAQLTGTLSLNSAVGVPAMTAMAFSTPKGPPPEPPPRSYQKGHGRSASLDLNARPPAVDFRGPVAATFGTLADSSRGTAVADGAKVLGAKIGLPNQRCLTLPANTTPSSHFVMFDSTDGLKQSQTIESAISSSATAVSETPSVTESSAASGNGKMASPPASAPPIPLKPDYHSRCAVLRQVNAELEAKLATLSQIRLQLRLRVDEIQGNATGPNNHPR